MNRREFLQRTTLATGAALAGIRPGTVAAEPPPETTTIKLVRASGLCIAPQYVAEPLLHTEGFTEVHYIEGVAGTGVAMALASGQVDISMNFVAPSLIRIEAGDPIALLAGVHVGCFELFGTDRVRRISDLKGKTVAVQELGSSQHTFLASMAAHVGLDPAKDIRWVTLPSAEAKRRLAAGTIDAYLAFPPDPQELRANRIGHVVVNSSVDQPWSQYFCCTLGGNREFVRRHPAATKRAIRAIVKATDVCALEPERAARAVVDRGFARSYDSALQTMKDVPYGRWREYDPEDTVRFYALRLREAGMITLTPQKLIAQGTDWRFLNELKKELKA